MQPALVIMRTQTGTQLLRSNTAAARVLQGAISGGIAQGDASAVPARAAAKITAPSEQDSKGQDPRKGALALRAGVSLVARVGRALQKFKMIHGDVPLVLVRAQRAEHAKFVGHVWGGVSLDFGEALERDAPDRADHDTLSLGVGPYNLDIIPVSGALEVEKDKGSHLVFLAAADQRDEFTTLRAGENEQDIVLCHNDAPLLNVRDADFAGSLRWMFGREEVVLKQENGIAAPSLLNVAV